MRFVGLKIFGFKPGDKCKLIDITISNMRRTALANKRGELPMDLLISELFSKVDVKGILAFSVGNDGKLNMHGKGDMYVKDIRQIAGQLLELTKNNNPDYCWSFR